jgi:hypothetical protein
LIISIILFMYNKIFIMSRIVKLFGYNNIELPLLTNCLDIDPNDDMYQTDFYGKEDIKGWIMSVDGYIFYINIDDVNIFYEKDERIQKGFVTFYTEKKKASSCANYNILDEQGFTNIFNNMLTTIIKTIYDSNITMTDMEWVADSVIESMEEFKIHYNMLINEYNGDFEKYEHYLTKI